MNRIARRSVMLLLFGAFLVAGLAFFVGEYFSNAEDWALFSGSPHVYDRGNLGCGIVTDRSGALLLDLRAGRTYCEDETVRRAMLHWLGDREGFVSAGALTHYAKELAGFDPVNGLYQYAGMGGNAELTLSAAVQAEALKALGDHKGTVAVYNYRTGQIICAVSSPTFDPDHVPDIDADTSGAYDGVFLNRFIQSVYVPGSIFKIVTAAAALEELPDILDQQFSCTGALQVENGQVTCEQPHGSVDLQMAMLRSCNCAFAQIALRLGEEKLDCYVKKFQITQPISFDGVTTVTGRVDILGTTEVELVWSAIGQYRDQVNPAAFLAFLGAVASGGEGVQPYIVQRISMQKSVLYEASVQKGPAVVSASTAQALRQMMQRNVTDHYGAENFPGLTVCAKTGTSQLGGGQISNAMFAGFVADEAYPFAFFVAVENAGYGKTVCVPIMSRVLAACKEMEDRR